VAFSDVGGCCRNDAKVSRRRGPDQQTDFRPCNSRNFRSLSATPGRSLLKSAANTAVGIARSDVAAQFRPSGMHGMPSMVPRKRRPRFGAFVIERHLVFVIERHLVLNFFERFARILQGCCDTRAIRRRVVFRSQDSYPRRAASRVVPANKLLPSLVLPLSLLSFLCYCFIK
jgi:hypothetical protein